MDVETPRIILTDLPRKVNTADRKNVALLDIKGIAVEVDGGVFRSDDGPGAAVPVGVVRRVVLALNGGVLSSLKSVSHSTLQGQVVVAGEVPGEVPSEVPRLVSDAEAGEALQEEEEEENEIHDDVLRTA